jgi:DNA-binding NtrC family response regulator
MAYFSSQIAIVEDDTTIRDLAVRALTNRMKRNILSFENGIDAWIHLENHDCTDIVVSDIDMPEMDGFELLTRIKKKYPNKICILMSGDPSNEKSAKELGADAFLFKPFKLDDLLNAVETFTG